MSAGADGCAPPILAPPSRRQAQLLAAFRTGAQGFETCAAEYLDCTLEGIEGDSHAGFGRRAGGREPWYPRGLTIRNERAVSLVSPADCAAIAQALGCATIAPEWLGANLLIDGLPHVSFLPAGTRLFFGAGAVLAVTAQNPPCTKTGKAVMRHLDRPAGQATEFVKAAQGRRGLVAMVEKPGRITPGDRVAVRIPAQWIYAG